MFEFLSYGAGVHSTAILVMLKPKTVIFADTGGEHPETYRYIREHTMPFCEANGIEFIVAMNPKWTLEEMALHDRIAPARTHRWCSDKFKVRVIRAWLEENGCVPAQEMIGFDANESHRAKASGRDDIVNLFPLLAAGMDRPACAERILAEGLPVPRKSGCWFCPFQSKSNWIELKQDRPHLFDRAATIEKNASGYERGFYLAGDKPLEDWIRSGRIRHDEDQYGLFKCACYEGVSEVTN
jgi:3'-phosphoadenosine 5'-phosphosulfate sulfotransferase (PAPS reductase)/FAD synthetase